MARAKVHAGEKTCEEGEPWDIMSEDAKGDLCTRELSRSEKWQGLPKREQESCSEYPHRRLWLGATRKLQNGDCLGAKVDPATKLYQGSQGNLCQSKIQP